MKYKIEYKSPSGIFPNEINNQFYKLHDRLKENKYEPDKIFLSVEHLKSYLIGWFANHLKENKKK